MARDFVVCNNGFSRIDDCGNIISPPQIKEIYTVLELKFIFQQTGMFTYYKPYYKLKELPTHWWPAWGFREVNVYWGHWRLGVMEDQINYEIAQGLI